MKADEDNGIINSLQNRDVINISLQKISQGTGIYIIGALIGTILGFVGRIIVVRYISQSEYGLYSLALVLMNIFVIMSTMGLREGSTRYIAYFRGEKEEGKIRDVVSSSIKIALIASIVFSSLLFLASNIISTNIFSSPELSIPLKILSIAIPFAVLMDILTSIFRGFDRAGPKVYFQDITRTTFFILLLGGVILFKLSFIGVIYSYLASIVISFICFVAYTIKKFPLPIFSVKERFHSSHIRKKLLLFSLPLLAVSTLHLIINWSDTLMLGYFKTPEVVGLYNGALPIAQLIPIILISASFIYIPIASGLYSKKLITEIGRIYQVLTKWIFSLTLPICLISIVFPETVLNFLFGVDYIQAAPVLRILSFGVMFNVFLGLNSHSLVVMEKTKVIMFASLIGAISNVILNVTLIPYFGIIGAALASLVAICMTNIFNSIKLYQISKIHPFTRNNVKSIIISIVLSALIYTSTIFIYIDFWTLPLILFLFLFSYGFLLIITKCIDKEDIELFLTIEKKSGLNLGPVKKILSRFL